MQKTKTYTLTKFSFEKIKEVYEIVFKDEKVDIKRCDYSISIDDEDWELDSMDEFCAEYSKSNCIYASLLVRSDNNKLRLIYNDGDTEISVESNRNIITKGFNEFDLSKDKFKLDKVPMQVNKIIVFIGHGRSDDWKIIKDDLQDKHKITIESFESGARAGHTIRDILEEMSTTSNFAILVLTAEDELKDGSIRARQNVIHEAGLFQGKLGFNRAIIVLQEDVEIPSNLDGIQQLRYKENIKEVIGDILATIKREFPLTLY
ncbi:TIR domain-containing protein [Legionella drancourtii]|uniref:CD-NTase-associated protein 12/Pycsar effector protein TIR domain-containing protein n=1 Tax=Legionella drancourtii LLAP12 TaxID=658187 RepID=G9ERS0_9GAMM|nr:nucleotide-binding protein [Legionella drancourtii]EHL30025.1 hypothetical protein LDG_7988 [Legionella drancourtii LLAP12]